MCIIVAKYFDGIGWAGAKNRDRNYTPTLDFIEDTDHDIGRMMMHDQITGYREGINSAGLSILNTSLDVYDDETEVEAGEEDSSPDGKIIAQALLYRNPLDAVKLLVRRHLGGCTIVFNQDDLYLVEATDDDGTAPYRYKAKKIDQGDIVARSNHGLWLTDAGYQRNPDDESETLGRISSESRLAQAEALVGAATKPQDLVDGMCQVYINHPQLNIMRYSTARKKMRTTSQQLCVPRERTLYCRPVSSHMDFDFWRLNKPHTNVWVEILGNRELWQNVQGDPPFAQMKMKDM